MTDGVTEKDRKSQLLDSGLSTKADKVKLLVAKSSDSMLPRKASRVNHIGTRTENRHRWARRVS